MIPPVSLAKLVVGYLEEEGLQKTAESFYQECGDSIRDNPQNTFAYEPSLKDILEDYLVLKQSVSKDKNHTITSQDNPENVVVSLWKDLDVLIAQLKYHTLTQPVPRNSQKRQRKKYNSWTNKMKPGPKPKPTGTNDTRVTNKPTNTSQHSHIQTVHPVCVTGILAPVGSPSQWQSVAIRKSGSYVPVHQEPSRITQDQNGGITQDQNRASELNRDQTLSKGISHDQSRSPGINNDQNLSQGINQDTSGSSRTVRDQNIYNGFKQDQNTSLDISMRFDRDQNSSKRGPYKPTRSNRLNQNGIPSTDISVQRPVTNRDELTADITIVEDRSNIHGNNNVLSDADQQRDQIEVLDTVAQQKQYKKRTTIIQQSHNVTPSLPSESEVHMSGVEGSMILAHDDLDITCVRDSDDPIADRHDSTQTSTGNVCGVVPYKPIHGMADLSDSGNVGLGTKSPKRKGHPPKKRQAPNPSPAKVLPLDSYPIHEQDYLHQILEGDKITDTAMPFLLDAFLNTPILQEKLAENINKVVKSTKPNEVVEEVITESLEKPSSATHDDNSYEQNVEIPVDDILSLLEADPVFDSLFSMIDGSKATSPSKETQSFPSCTTSEPVATNSNTACSTSSDSQAAGTSLVTESLLLLISSPPKLSTSTSIIPSLETTTTANKQLTPENNTTIVDISSAETEVHVRALKFSNEETPEQEKEQPQKITSSKKKLVSPSKRIRCRKKHKKSETTPKRKLLLPNVSPPTYIQPMYKGLQTIPYTNTPELSNTTNTTNTNIGGCRSSRENNTNMYVNGSPDEILSGMNLNGKSNGMRKPGGTMLQLLQDAAAIQRVKGIQTCSAVMSHTEGQPTSSDGHVHDTVAITTVASSQALNITGNNTLCGNSLMSTTPGLFVVHSQTNPVTQPSDTTQQDNTTLQTNQVTHLDVATHQGHLPIQATQLTGPNVMSQQGNHPVQLTQHQVIPQPRGILNRATMQQNNILQYPGIPNTSMATQLNDTPLPSNHVKSVSTLNTGPHLQSYNLMGDTMCAANNSSCCLGTLAEYHYSQAIAKLASSVKSAAGQSDVTTLSCTTRESDISLCSQSNDTNQSNTSGQSNDTNQSVITISSDKDFSSGSLNQSVAVINSERTNPSTNESSIMSSDRQVSSHGSRHQSNILVQNSKGLQDKVVPQHSSHLVRHTVSSTTNNQPLVSANYQAFQAGHSSHLVSQTAMSSTNTQSVSTSSDLRKPLNQDPTSQTNMSTNQSISNNHQPILCYNSTISERTLVKMTAQEKSAELSQCSPKPTFTPHSSDNKSCDNSVTGYLSGTNKSTVVTPQKQLLSILAQTPGQSSTESSPASKTAELCVSSFCSISSEGSTHLTIQNNAFTTHDTNQPNNSSSLTRDLSNKLERLGESENERGRREFEKDCGSEKESAGRKDEGVVQSTSAITIETGKEPAITRETGKEPAIRQALKRSGSPDLKENKPKKPKQSKGSKKSKSKGGLPKNFDVDKFLSKLHYVEK